MTWNRASLGRRPIKIARPFIAACCQPRIPGPGVQMDTRRGVLQFQFLYYRADALAYGRVYNGADTGTRHVCRSYNASGLKCQKLRPNYSFLPTIIFSYPLTGLSRSL
jgi:hypothetical protein